MLGILILADFRPTGYKLSCFGSLWSKVWILYFGKNEPLTS